MATTALAVGAAIAAAPAQAAGPTHFTDPLSFSTDDHWLSDVCGFPIAFHVEGSANAIQSTDASGNVTRALRGPRDPLLRYRLLTDRQRRLRDQ